MTPDLHAAATTLAADLATLHRAGRIASPWRAGMADSRGGRVVYVARRDDEMHVCYDCHTSDYPASSHPHVPDLSDEATVDGVVRLAREAWGDPGLTTGQFIVGGWKVVHGGAFGWKLLLTAPTEALAACAAIRAAAAGVGT